MTEKVTSKITPLKNKPKSKKKTGSKYDSVIQGFIDANVPLAHIEVEGKTGNYLATQLGKRIEAESKFSGVTVSTVNGECYLEREIPKKKDA